mgnify:CR=1 FL=1
MDHASERKQCIVMKAFDKCNDSENYASQEETVFNMQTENFKQNLDASMKLQFCSIMYKVNHNQ